MIWHDGALSLSWRPLRCHSRWQKQPFDRWICILLTFSSLAKSSDDIQTEPHAKLKGQEEHQPNWNNIWSLTWKGMSISWISACNLWVAQVTWIFYPLFRVSHRRPVLKGFLTSGCTSNRCSLELCWSSRAENFSLDAFQKTGLKVEILKLIYKKSSTIFWMDKKMIQKEYKRYVHPYQAILGYLPCIPT